ncbi:MAG: phosphate butyryltransferase [Bacillota bacterium]|nr:phosphate butyryltransferase [Bacillota bacterium]
MFRSLKEVIHAAGAGEPARVAVAQAADPEVLAAVAEARRLGLAEGVLCGEPAAVEAALREIGEDPAHYSIVPAADPAESAVRAVAAVNAGEADFLMKGLLPTATFLHPVLDKEKGLRTDRLISQISIFDWAEAEKLLLITDCAINIAPDLKQKKAILENALAVAHALGIEEPRVAPLAALEFVNPDMPETLDAAALAKMADRGELRGAVVDGPLALDNAVSPEAARHKGIGGPVAGRADIILTPDMKTGNVLHKALVHFAHFRCAAAVVGARVPLVMTSRSDSADAKLCSIAVAGLLARRR